MLCNVVSFCELKVPVSITRRNWAQEDKPIALRVPEALAPGKELPLLRHKVNMEQMLLALSIHIRQRSSHQDLCFHTV